MKVSKLIRIYSKFNKYQKGKVVVSETKSKNQDNLWLELDAKSPIISLQKR